MLETYNKKCYIFEAQEVENIDSLIESKKFINIWWQRINVNNISNYWKVPSNPTYDFIVSMPKTTRHQGLKIVRRFENDKSTMSMVGIKDLVRELIISLKIPVWERKSNQTLNEYVISYLHDNYPNDK